MDIAIIGMAGRFPGASSIGEFWSNLAGGVPGLVATPAEDPDRIHVDTRFCDIRLFEPEFFGISDGEARLLDPQHRVLLECAHEALEDAGYGPFTCSSPVGVFAGSGFNHYFMYFVGPDLRTRRANGDDPALALLANERDFLASRISYRLNLRGPGVTVQTACSTSLVAVHLACQSLRAFEADLCLAGGVSIDCSLERSHVYREGGILSRDGRCRAFDADATGTTFGDGAAMVVLKRLDEALRDDDDIYAVIKGSTINNDGAAKVGYTAPSVHQYAALVQEALGVCGVGAETIGFVEGHGTGTRLGDAVEIRALTEAFRRSTAREGFCVLGSVKSQVGHLDVAAGVTGLIKAALSLRHRLIPPTLHFETPNPALQGSPFYVASRPISWAHAATTRRAAVSSLGIGGTNVHAILEEPPPRPAVAEDSPHLLVLSARSDGALAKAAGSLAAFLKRTPGAGLTRVAYTLQAGRHHHSRRLAIVAKDAFDAVDRLEEILAAGIEPRVRACDGAGRWGSIAQAYVEGQVIDWSAVRAGRPGRVHLPTYPFERRPFWFQARSSAPATAAAASLERPAHLFTIEWRRAAEPPGLTEAPKEHWLFIGARDGLAFESARACEALGMTVWRGAAAEAWSPVDERLACLNPASETDLRSLLRWVAAGVGRPEGIVFEPAGSDGEPEALQVSRLARLLCETWPAAPLHLAVLTHAASERTVAVGDVPAVAPATAAALVGAAEYPLLRVRCLDVDDPATVFGLAPQPARRFVHELLRRDGSDCAVFAAGFVWEKEYVAADDRAGRPLLKRDGVYLITGGLGGVGLEIAEYLADRGPVRLALVSRRRFSLEADDSSADDPGEVRRRLQRIRGAGASIEVFSADVADAAQMRRVIDHAEASWGPIDGVFHAAGLAGGALMPGASREGLARLCRPKGEGAQVLARLFAGRPLDFLLLFSSTTTAFPTVGQLEYCAANMFLDVLAPVLRRDHGIPAYSISWPLWQGVGMAAHVDVAQFTDGPSAPRRSHGLTRHEARLLLDAWAAGGWPPHVIVAASRPESRVQRPGPAPSPAPASRSRDQVTAVVREIWADLLGGADVRDDEDFFDRGGDSLMAVQLIGRIRKAFGTDYSFDRFFDGPTIRDVVAYLLENAGGVPERSEREVQPVFLSR